MEERKFPSPANVADAFVKQYFVILDKSPENLHKFYLEPSLLGWPGIDGVVTPVTTLKVSHFITTCAANCNLELCIRKTGNGDCVLRPIVNFA